MGGGGAHSCPETGLPPPPAAAAFGSDRSEAAPRALSWRTSGSEVPLKHSALTLGPCAHSRAGACPRPAGAQEGQAGRPREPGCAHLPFAWTGVTSGVRCTFSPGSPCASVAPASQRCVGIKGCPPPGASPLLVPHTALPPLAPSLALPGLALGGARGGFSAAVCEAACEDGVRAGRAGLGLGRGGQRWSPHRPARRSGCGAAGGPHCGC